MTAGTWVVIASLAAGLIAAGWEIRLRRQEQVIRRHTPVLRRYFGRMDEQRLLRAWSTADTYRLLTQLSRNDREQDRQP